MNIVTDELDVYLVYVLEGKVVGRLEISNDTYKRISQQIVLQQMPAEVEIDANLRNNFCCLMQQQLPLALVAKLLRTSEDEVSAILKGQKRLFKSSLMIDLSSLVDRLR